MTTENLKIALAVALVGALTVALFVDQPRVTHEQAQASAARRAQAQLSAATADVQQIPVTFTMTAPLRQFYHGRSTDFETARDIEFWALLETQDVVLINNDVAGAQTCPEALAAFMSSFASLVPGSVNHVSYGMNIRSLRDIVNRMHGKTVPVNVRIPLFDGRPKGLENCPDFAWVENSHRLTYRDKPVAVMMAEQPQLGLAH